MTKSVPGISSKEEGSIDVDRLLTHGYLGGSDYDAIEERVLAQTLPASRRAWLRWSAAGASVAAIAAGVAVFLARPDDLRVKGEANPAFGSVEVACNRPLEHTCRQGDRLLFVVDLPKHAGYLNARAERLDDPENSRIWYFPGSDGTSPRIGGAEGLSVAPEGILIGTEHAPGRYRVRVWVTVRPVTRAELEDADDTLAPIRVTREITVEP